MAKPGCHECLWNVGGQDVRANEDASGLKQSCRPVDIVGALQGPRGLDKMPRPREEAEKGITERSRTRVQTGLLNVSFLMCMITSGYITMIRSIMK